MLKKILDSNLFWVAALLLVSTAMAHLFVRGLDWRYKDFLGISAQTFDASNSIMAYTLHGVWVWPLFGISLWLIASSMATNFRKPSVRQ